MMSWRECPAATRRIRLELVTASALWLAAVGEPLHAQSYRGWTGTNVLFTEMRPFGLDSVPRADVVTDAGGRFLYDGHEVTCVTAETCTGYLPLDETRTAALTQDLSLTLWGLGVQGLSFTTLLRGRLKAGDAFAWPRSDDEFDALLGYAQLQRGPLRVRAGRQDNRSGLGFSGFDGVSGAYDLGRVRGELYGGRSLGRGLREPRNTAARGLEDFYVDHGALLFGGDVTLRAFGALATARYQRELQSDRSGLVSERASLDVSATVPRARVTGSADYDFSFRRVGKAHLTVSAPLDDGRWLVELSGRRYVPYFDLSTIWGFFEPVSYSEVVTRAGWSPSGTLAVQVSGGWRAYGDTRSAVVLRPLTDTGWRVDGRARWVPAPRWELDGEYQLEWGPGGFLSSADVGVRRSLSERLAGSVSVMTFQQVEEFRLGDGRALGGSVSADYVLEGGLAVTGGVSVLRHRDGGTVFTSPWNQMRAWTSLRVPLGRDPGMSTVGGVR